MTHEEDGAVKIWVEIKLLCWECGKEYWVKRGESTDCHECGRGGVEYDIIDYRY